MKEFVLYIACLLCLVFLLPGCEDDIPMSEQPASNHPLAEKVQIEIFARANPYHYPVTRATADEGKVGKTPWILVFRGENADATFVEAVQAFELVGKRYVLLTRQSYPDKYQLLILANPLNDKFYYGNAISEYSFTVSDILMNMVPGTTKLSEVCTKMLTPPSVEPATSIIPFSNGGETIPMSYLLGVDKIDTTTKIENSDGSMLQLVRAVAKMVIVNKADNFYLKGITAVANVPRQGQLHNHDGFIMDNTANLTEYCHIGYSAPLITADHIAVGQSTEMNPLYLYETDVQNKTSLIIQGTYENKDYYYKMALVNDNYHGIDILRNHSYTFTIVKAKGPGYDTVEDAKAAKASNVDLDYKILIDDSYSYEMMSNNDFYLGVSNSVFITYTNEDKVYEVVSVATDCKMNFPNSCRINDNHREVDDAFSLTSPSDGERIPIVGGSTPDPNITQVEALVTYRLRLYEDYQMDEEGNYRNNAHITLKLGNLEKKIRVRQRPAVPEEGQIIKYMPVTDNADSYDMDYYCLSAYVEDGTDNPENWIKLRPSTGAGRDITDRITVDDGKIYMEVIANTGTAARSGIVYLTTIKDPDGSSGVSTTQRVKISITQKGRTIVSN